MPMKRSSKLIQSARANHAIAKNFKYQRVWISDNTNGFAEPTASSRAISTFAFKKMWTNFTSEKWMREGLAEAVQKFVAIIMHMNEIAFVQIYIIVGEGLTTHQVRFDLALNAGSSSASS